jgi:hypothetical protein
MSILAPLALLRMLPAAEHAGPVFMLRRLSTVESLLDSNDLLLQTRPPTSASGNRLKGLPPAAHSEGLPQGLIPLMQLPSGRLLLLLPALLLLLK